MIPDEKTDNVGQQKLIELLCRMAKTDEESVTTAEGNNDSEITIVEENPAVVEEEEGEIITLDDDDDDDEDQKREVEDGEITGESEESEDDDVEELNLRLNALRSLAGAKKTKRQKTKKVRLRRRRSNDNYYRLNDDTDLRATIRRRSSSRHSNQTTNHDDREYLLDKDYRQTSIFDRLFSLISSNGNTSSKNHLDNYDIQQMDIVDDYPISAPPLPPLPPLPPPLPPSHLPFFDPLPPLPPPPPSIFNMFPVNQSMPLMDWPRPNFVPQMQTDLWPPGFNNTTDVDLRLQPIGHHHPMISPRMNENRPAKRLAPMKRKRAKKRHEKRKADPLISRPILIEKPPDPPIAPIDEDDEEEQSLRELLLRTLSSKRKVKIVEPTDPEPDRIVTIIPSNSPPPPTTAVPIPVLTTVQTLPVVNKSVEISSKSQYSINQRYKRVKANVSATNLTSKTETVNTTTTTTTTVVRTTQPIFQTRNKIVRVVPETEIDIPQTNPIIVTFDEPITDEDEHQTHDKPPQSTYVIPDEERQAIKRLQQAQEEVIRRSNTVGPPKAPSPPVQTVQEAIPSTDELSALFEKRRMLLNERSKYGDILGKMKKKKLENGLLAREVEKLEEQLSNRKAQIISNHTLLQRWQKEAMAIAQNIKQQEDLILQSAIFKSTKPDSSPLVKTPTTPEFDYANLIKLFDDHNRQILLSILICPLNFYRKLHSYQTWFKIISTKIEQCSTEDESCLLLRTRSFTTDNNELFWKTSLQAYFLDINQILCPYELQGSCKAQTCIYQHQHQITQRIDQFLSSKKFNEKNKQKLLNQMESSCSIPVFDLDFSILEKKIQEKQYQRCRTKLDRYLSIYHEDFRYFRDPSSQSDLSIIHPILLRVSNQLDSDDFSVEHAVADLVEGLELDRTNAQLWCLYLEFSSWHMSTGDLHHLCSAALKNAQSYDLFWTIFYLCANNIDEFLSNYWNYLQSDRFDFHHRSFAICEFAMFHAHLASNCDEAQNRMKIYLSDTQLNDEHRLYLLLVLIYTYAFGSFPRILYERMDDNRFEKSVDVEPFICPWYTSMEYAHSPDEIDRFWDELINSSELSKINLPLYINRFHYLNATKRCDQARVYLETLIEIFPHSMELWMELLTTTDQPTAISEILDRARKFTGIYYELVYSLSSKGSLTPWLNDASIPKKTLREKFFYDLCHSSSDILEKKMDEYLFRSNEEFEEIIILELFFQFSNFSSNFQRKILTKILPNIVTLDQHQRILILYSFFEHLPIGRCLDILIDYSLFNHIDSYEWIIKPFSYRLLDLPIRKDPNPLFWIRFDAFTRQMIINHSSEEIYLILLQRSLLSMESNSKVNMKIARLCRLFEKHFPHGHFIVSQLRQLAFNSILPGIS